MDLNKYFIHLLSTYLHGEAPEACDDINMEQLSDMAALNDVSGIVYTQLQKINGQSLDNDVFKRMETLFYADMMRYSRRCVLKNMIEDAFRKEKIRFAYVKGSILCNFYNDPELRTMGDLDILIDRRDIEKTHEIMSDLGAEYNREASQEDEWKYMLNKTVVEIHTKLICDDVAQNVVDFEKYFADEINNLHMVDDFYGELIPERHFLFIVTHMARHLSHTGCGIRMFMDLHVIKNYYGDKLDYSYIINELEALKLDRFADCAFGLCNYWFDSGFESSASFDLEQRKMIEQFILEAGPFGYFGRNTEALKISRNGILRHIFPSYREMRQHSAWFADKSAILLPIAYLERGIRNLKERGGAVKWIKNISGAGGEIDYHKRITNLLGL